MMFLELFFLFYKLGGSVAFCVDVVVEEKDEEGWVVIGVKIWDVGCRM